MTEAIKHLLIINVILFVATLTSFGETIYRYLALWFPEHPYFEWWQIVSHMFMHGGVMHIAFNMYALWAFGSPLERMWGRNKFLFFYFSAGFGAALLHIGYNYFLFNNTVEVIVDSGIGKADLINLLNEGTANLNVISDVLGANLFEDFRSSYLGTAVGASGAVYGILVAFAFMFPNAELMLIFLPIPIKAKYFVPVLILGDLFFGFSNVNTGIAHFAHIGGALIGFIMMWYWKKNQFNQNRWN